MDRNRKPPVGDGRKLTLPRFIAVDFFCGAGGTSCGLIGAGGYVIAGIDKDDLVDSTYRLNNRNRTLDRKYPEFLKLDIFAKTAEYPNGQQHELFQRLDELIAAARIECPDVPLLFAICAPCQPFTSLSRKEMTKDRQAKRARDSGLLREALKFVKVYGPEYVLSENVAGISGDKYGGVWQDFTSGLEETGYFTGTAIVDASDFGVPQFRKRSILLAVQRKPYEARTGFSEVVVPLTNSRGQQLSVKDAIAHFPRLRAGEHLDCFPNHRTRGLSDLNVKRISSARPGESNKYLLTTKFGDLSLPCHNRVNAKFKQRCFNDVYTRMHPDTPAPTITTKCHSISNGRFGHFDRRQNRGISLREAAALQSFPDRYVFYPEDRIGVVACMIGNAVPPKLARFFANYLVSGSARRSLSDRVRA